MSIKVEWLGDQAKAAAKRGRDRGLQLGAEHILEESRRIVPIEEGTLERDGVASSDPGAGRAAVSYGIGGAAPYACRQHEELTWAHNAGRQAKYLEQPFNSERHTVLEIIASETKSALGA